MKKIKITGTLIWYYFVCKREVWLMSREINSNQDNQLLEIGRIIAEESYRREIKEINFGNIKIDLIKKKNGELWVCEIKKSSRFLKPAEMQLAFYLLQLKKQGIEARGELLIPKEKKRFEVELTDEIKEELYKAISEIKEIVSMEKPPPPEKNRFCSKCSYYEFCWS
jgi:CRISPR-associated exonuclease Cas4